MTGLRRHIPILVVLRPRTLLLDVAEPIEVLHIANREQYVSRAWAALARNLPGQTRLDMERVAERAGSGSARHMRRLWRRFYPTPPMEVRRA